MRPRDIDFSSRAKHFFDVTNGEVLAGVNERNAYIAAGADPEHVRFIGALLRAGADDLPNAAPELYDQVDYSQWRPERFQAYGRWIRNLVDEPESSRHRKISGDVFDNANHMGIGPGYSKLRRDYGTLSSFYVEIDAKDAQIRQKFDDWDLDQFVDYVRRIGGERRPSQVQLAEASKASALNPSYRIIANRYKHIGGLNKVLELAGYPVIPLWERDDYLDWGVRFMQANDGILPTSPMIDYLSRSKLGPSCDTVRLKFSGIANFQDEIKKYYVASKHEQIQQDTEMLNDIAYRLRNKTLPVELFIGTDDETTEPPLIEDVLEDSARTQEVLNLYAKFIVLEKVVANSSDEKRVSVCRDSETAHAFVVACGLHNPVHPADIEYEATTLGVFDYIWSMKDHIKSLKIDEAFEADMAEQRAKGAAAWHRRKAKKLAAA